MGYLSFLLCTARKIRLEGIPDIQVSTTRKLESYPLGSLLFWQRWVGVT